MTLKTSNSNCRVIVASLKQIAAGKNERDPLTKKTKGAIHSTKIPTGPTGKSGPPQKVDPFFETFPVGPNRSIEFWTEISGNFG